MIKKLYREKGNFEVTSVDHFKFSSKEDPIELSYNDVPGWTICCRSNTKVGMMIIVMKIFMAKNIKKKF